MVIITIYCSAFSRHALIFSFHNFVSSKWELIFMRRSGDIRVINNDSSPEVIEEKLRMACKPSVLFWNLEKSEQIPD